MALFPSQGSFDYRGRLSSVFTVQSVFNSASFTARGSAARAVPSGRERRRRVRVLRAMNRRASKSKVASADDKTKNTVPKTARLLLQESYRSGFKTIAINGDQILQNAKGLLYIETYKYDTLESWGGGFFF